MDAALNETARALVAPGKGILAADESSGTIKKRFDSIGCESTEDRRRAYREMLFTTTGAGDHVSGVILFDETIRQSASDGRPLPKILESQGIIPGIKVDKGTTKLAKSPDELVTDGLDGLRARLVEYRDLGARFAKWRAVITIGAHIPSRLCLDVNAARARALRRAVPGRGHRADRRARGADGRRPLDRALLPGDHRHAARVCSTRSTRSASSSRACCSSRTWCCPGKGHASYPVSPDVVADATLSCFRATVPAAVPGIVFLSGGQGDEEATANLNAMNARARTRGACRSRTVARCSTLRSTPGRATTRTWGPVRPRSCTART